MPAYALSVGHKISSIHYHQQPKDHRLLSKGPRFPYPGYPKITDATPEQFGPVKTWQVAACEREYQRSSSEGFLDKVIVPLSGRKELMFDAQRGVKLVQRPLGTPQAFADVPAKLLS